MARYAILTGWFLVILLLGIIESALSVPILAIGLLLFTVNNQRWWLRLTLLVFAGLVWGTVQAISPTVLVGLLFVGVWVKRWSAGTIHQRTSIFYTTILIAIVIGIVRSVPLTLGALLLILLQVGIFWNCTHWLVSSRTKPLQFFLPPPTTHVKTAR